MKLNPDDLAKEQRKIAKRGLVASLACVATLVPAAVYLPSRIEFPVGTAEQLAFVVRVDLFVAIWVVIGIRLVSRIRFSSIDDNAGSAYSAPSVRLAVPAAFLQNTLEQAFTAIVGHLALVAVGGEATMAFVVAATVLFTLGRITFLLGYPAGAGGRAFGMVMTMLPTIGAYGWALVDTAIRVGGLIQR